MVIINSILLFQYINLKKQKNKFLYNCHTIAYTHTSTLPFGNSRTRVLIEPLLIVTFIDSVKNIFQID